VFNSPGNSSILSERAYRPLAKPTVFIALLLLCLFLWLVQSVPRIGGGTLVRDFGIEVARGEWSRARMAFVSALFARKS
jgi:hypothetical protein